MATILIVDDESQSREYFRCFLESSGWHAVTASNGQDALEKMKIRRPDAIVLDMTMPEMDGFELARRLKSNPEYQTIPILAATGLRGRGDRERCIAAGCNDYVAKPLSVQQLKQRLNVLLTAWQR
jgi:CheY-like chemotaxis protein